MLINISAHGENATRRVSPRNHAAPHHFTRVPTLSRMIPTTEGDRGTRSGRNRNCCSPSEYFWCFIIANIHAWGRRHPWPPPRNSTEIADGTWAAAQQIHAFPVLPGVNCSNEAEPGELVRFVSEFCGGREPAALSPPSGPGLPCAGCPRSTATETSETACACRKAAGRSPRSTGLESLATASIGAPVGRVAFEPPYFPPSKTVRRARRKTGDLC